MSPQLQQSIEQFTALGNGIHQIRLPMTDHVLRYINAYLIEGDDGYTLVDCGWGLPDVLEALQAALDQIGVPLDRIKTVIATHFHPDHYGLAGTLARMAGARVLMHRADWLVLDARFRDLEGEVASREKWLKRNGLDLTGFSAPERIRWMKARYSLVAPERELEDGEILSIGSHRFQVVWTPGHTPGHICLYDAERETLLSGDHVLPGITPHISYWENMDPDPLGSFVASLKKVAALGAKKGLPAHREPIADLAGRIDEILAHHVDREVEVIAAFGGGWLTGAAVASRLSWRRNTTKFDELPMMHKTNALAETLAHLEHLRANGRAERESTAEVVRYRLLSATAGAV